MGGEVVVVEMAMRRGALEGFVGGLDRKVAANGSRFLLALNTVLTPSLCDGGGVRVGEWRLLRGWKDTGLVVVSGGAVRCVLRDGWKLVIVGNNVVVKELGGGGRDFGVLGVICFWEEVRDPLRT